MNVEIAVRINGEISESMELSTSGFMSLMGFINKCKNVPIEQKSMEPVLKSSASTLKSEPEQAKVKTKIKVDINELKRLYIDEGLTADETAKRMGISPASLWQLTKEHGIYKGKGNKKTKPPEYLSKDQFVDKAKNDLGLD